MLILNLHNDENPTKSKKASTIIRLSMPFSVGVTGFEPATTRPPDAYSNRAELHPAVMCLSLFDGCKGTHFF